MATPANRVPVRIARGSKANLDTAIAAGDLKEGEICYATDENGIYVVEGGTLTQAGADLATTSIDALSDVDTSTAAPTDGQALVWNNSVSQWEPGGVSGEIEWTLTANGTTDYIFAGAGFAGTETDPDIYVMRGQTYKFTNEMGAHPFQIQSTQGTSGTAYNDGITNNGVSNGTLTWEVRMDAPSTLYYQCTSHALMAGVIHVLDEGSAVASIDDLSDVDTSTVAPTDGQALVWDNANSKWEPGTISGSGVSSVNTQTGAVSLGIEDLDDFLPNQSSTQTIAVWDNYPVQNGGDGDWTVHDGTGVRVSNNDKDGNDQTTFLSGLTTMWLSQDGTNWHERTVSSITDYNGHSKSILFTTANGLSGGGTLYIADQDNVLTDQPLAEGDILQYESATSKFRPVQLGVDGLSDVDTSTVAPTDGQALVWDNTAGKWEPGTVSGGGGTTLPSGTADGEALIWEDGAWVVGPVIGGVDYVPSGAITNSTPPTGFSVWVDTWNTGVSGATYSNSDRTATHSSGDVAAYSATAKSTGKWYTELSLVGVDTDMIIGFATSNTAGIAGTSGTGGLGIRQGGSSFNDASVTIDAGYSNAWGYSNYVMFAIDFDAKLIWFGVNGTWQNSGDPAAGTGYVFSAWTGSPTWYLGLRLLSSGDSGTWEPYAAANVTIPYSIDKLDDVDTSTVAPTDGQVLSWDNAASQWEPASLRTLLGIGEYADDTAAGTGGLSSGELYYNTTSSSYVLKS